MKRLRVVVMASLLCGPWLVAAEVARSVSQDQHVDARLKQLSLELRCLVCQNQTLADSHAPLAEDLRAEIRSMMARGLSDEEIVDFLVSRYGDFVRYRPPLKSTTWLLWFGPFLFLVAGGAALGIAIRRRQRLLAEASPSDDEKNRAAPVAAAEEIHS